MGREKEGCDSEHIRSKIITAILIEGRKKQKELESFGKGRMRTRISGIGTKENERNGGVGGGGEWEGIKEDGGNW